VSSSENSWITVEEKQVAKPPLKPSHNNAYPLNIQAKVNAMTKNYESTAVQPLIIVVSSAASV